MIEKYTEGRSGSFFYFSEDGDYIVKTLTESGPSVRVRPHQCLLTDFAACPCWQRRRSC